MGCSKAPAMRFPLLAAAGAALATTGCGTTLSTLQPAEPMRPGHVQAQGAFNVNVPASRIYDAVDTVATLGDRYASDPSYKPTTEEQQRAFAAGAGLGLSSPGVNPDLMLRVGVVKNLDAGIRWSGIAAHLDAKYRFLRTKEAPPDDDPSKQTSGVSNLGNGPDDPGFQGSISVGVSKALYSGFVFDALEFLHIDDYSRWNVEVPVIFGSRLGDFGHAWFGPKYVYSHYALDASLQNVGIVQESSGSIHHLGGFAGIGFGYKVAFLFLELTVMDMISKPEILGQRVDLGGIVVVPSFGLMLRL
jgi:hypothetical protein